MVVWGDSVRRAARAGSDGGVICWWDKCQKVFQRKVSNAKVIIHRSRVKQSGGSFCQALNNCSSTDLKDGADYSGLLNSMPQIQRSGVNVGLCYNEVPSINSIMLVYQNISFKSESEDEHQLFNVHLIYKL